MGDQLCREPGVVPRLRGGVRPVWHRADTRNGDCGEVGFGADTGLELLWPEAGGGGQLLGLLLSKLVI